MADRWVNQPVPCRGGLRLDLDKLTLGTEFPGACTVLQNYEPSIYSGYERIKGYTKYSSTQVPGSGNILAVKPALGGVFAVRKTATDNALYYSTGTTWGSILNTTARTGSPTKARIISYDITEPAICVTDGVNPAGKWDGTNYVHLTHPHAPPSPKYATTFRDRLVLAPGSTSSTVALSAPANDEDFNGANGATEINVGDTVTGVYTFRDTLYIFCKNSIFKLTGSTSSDFVVSDVTKKIGCLGHDTIQEVGGDLIFLSQTGLRTISATERTDDIELGVVSRGIQPILREYLDKDETAYSSVAIPSKNQYRLFIYDSTLAATSTINFLGKLTDTPIDPKGIYEWATLTGMRASCSEWNYDEENEIAVFANGSDGYVYRMESGDSFDGSAITSICRLADMTFGNATLRKVLHKINVFTQITGDISVNLNVLFDFENDGVIQPPTVVLSQTGAVSKWDNFVWDTGVWAAVQFPVFKKNLIGSGFTAAFQFSSTDSNPPHRIDSLDITVAPKARR